MCSFGKAITEMVSLSGVKENVCFSGVQNSSFYSCNQDGNLYWGKANSSSSNPPECVNIKKDNFVLASEPRRSLYTAKVKLQEVKIRCADELLTLIR